MNEGASQVLHKFATSDTHQPILSATHFHPVHYIDPWSTAGCSLLMQPVLSGITRDASATAAQLRVASSHGEGSLPYPPVAGFHVLSSQQNDIRAARVAEMVGETRHKSSSKQAKNPRLFPSQTLLQFLPPQLYVMKINVL